MRFDILGPLQVLDGGRPLPLGRPKQRAVLAILLLDPGTVVSLDRLVDELWGRQAPPQSLASVHAYVSHLRRLLEPQRPAGAPASVLVNQAPGYRIVVADDDLDAVRFQALARTGHTLLRTGDASRAADTLAEALRLWRGPVLADFADASFVQAERSRLEELRLTALEDRLSADLRVGRHALIVAELDQLTGEHPFRERLQGLRMAALYLGGRQAEALQAYQRFRAQLREELGLDPGPALRMLERDILRQEAQLNWMAAVGVDLAAPGPAPAPALETAPTTGVAVDGAHPDVTDGLAGRQPQLRVIDRALAGTSASRGRVILVTGEPGIGKTRLAEEAARRARASGITVSWGRSDQEAGTLAFWLWTQLIRELLSAVTVDSAAAALGPHAAELSPILPELSDGTPPAPAPLLDVQTSRFRLCQAATAALLHLSRDRRLLLVLDDLQWADVASQRLLSHLAATLHDAPVVVLATYRDRTLDGGEPLADTLAELARTAPVDRLPLAGLGPADVATVMVSHFGSAPDERLARLVSDRTGGNPFFVMEVLRLLHASGWPARTTDDAASLVAQQIPVGVRDVLRRRLARLPDQSRTVLLVAAVIGQEFDLDVLRAVTGLDDDDALDAVELSVLSGLVTEDSARVGRFRFAHAMIREAVYGEISRARQARLHARVAPALSAGRRQDADHVLQVAHHWWLAASVTGAERAVPHVMAAAQICLDTRAHEEAERQLSRSLDLLADTPASASRTASELDVQLRLGTLLVQLHGTGSERAWASFARARDLANEIGDSSAVLAAYRSLYEVAFARADHRLARALAEDIVELAHSSDDPAEVVVGHLALGRTLWAQGRPTSAKEHLELGMRLASEAHDARELVPPKVTLQLQLAAVLDLLGELEAAAGLVRAAVAGSPDDQPFVRAAALTGAALMAGLRRDLTAARAWATAALDLASRWNFPAPGGYAAVVLSWVTALEADPAVAIPELRRHLDEIETGGARHLLAWGLGLLAEAHLRDRRPEEALRLIDEGIAQVSLTGERLYESELHRLRALCLVGLAPPSYEEAHSALQQALTVASEQGSVLLQRRAAETDLHAPLDLTAAGATTEAHHPEAPPAARIPPARAAPPRAVRGQPRR
ncbi:BTAD domain-containing putative transcriptional regulator [Geodermatophilus sp. SYSU D00814]